MSAAGVVGLFVTGAVAAATSLLLREYERAGDLAGALVAWFPSAGMVAAGTGAAVLTWLGWTRRIGHRPHCACCGYERCEGARLVACCPECGSPWRWIGWTVEGRPVSRPGLLLSGGLLGLLSLAGTLALATDPRLIARGVPDRLLVLHAAVAPWYANLEAWREIRCRRLSAQEELWLASRLLDRARRGDELCPEAENWLGDLGRAGRLPLAPGARLWAQSAGL